MAYTSQYKITKSSVKTVQLVYFFKSPYLSDWKIYYIAGFNVKSSKLLILKSVKVSTAGFETSNTC